MFPCDRDHLPVLGMRDFESESNSKEGFGGFYTLIFISIFPLCCWLVMRKGEWYFLTAEYEELVCSHPSLHICCFCFMTMHFLVQGYNIRLTWQSEKKHFKI